MCVFVRAFVRVHVRVRTCVYECGFVGVFAIECGRACM